MQEEFVGAFCHLEGLHVLLGLWDALLTLVGLGEHERERHLRICQPACALDVGLLNALFSIRVYGLSMPACPPSEQVLCVFWKVFTGLIALRFWLVQEFSRQRYGV